MIFHGKCYIINVTSREVHTVATTALFSKFKNLALIVKAGIWGWGYMPNVASFYL